MAYRQRQAGSTNARGGREVPSNTVAPVEPAAVLAAAKATRYAQLWTACDAYERQFYSGGIHAQILELKLAGSAKAVACQRWILALWRDYYSRVDAVSALTTAAAVPQQSMDFSAHGRPPYTVRDMLADAPAA